MRRSTTLLRPSRALCGLALLTTLPISSLGQDGNGTGSAPPPPPRSEIVRQVGPDGMTALFRRDRFRFIGPRRPRVRRGLLPRPKSQRVRIRILR